MKFCTKTKGLSEEQNKQYAKDLKAFTKKEISKLQNESDEETENE